MNIRKELLDELLQECKTPPDLFGEGGILKQLRADICSQDLQVGQSKVLSKLRLVWRHLLYIAAMRLEDGDLLIVPTAHDPDKAIADYDKCWAIETLFSLGFDFLRHIIFDLHLNSQVFFNSIKFLSCT
ncbi:MAG: hypothetical protein ACK6DE_07270 [Pseudanabaena sp.]